MSEQIVTEEWRPVVGWNGYYEVSSAGRVRGVGRYVKWNVGLQFRKGRILKPYKRPPLGHGTRVSYSVVWLCRNSTPKTCLVHRLVVEAFIGPITDGLQTNHKDGDGHNNAADNLELVTAKENMRHARFVLRRQMGGRGEQASAAKLTDEKVREIRGLIAAGQTNITIGKRYGVAPSAICNINTRKTWGHVV